MSSCRTSPASRLYTNEPDAPKVMNCAVDSTPIWSQFFALSGCAILAATVVAALTETPTAHRLIRRAQARAVGVLLCVVGVAWTAMLFALTLFGDRPIAGMTFAVA